MGFKRRLVKYYLFNYNKMDKEKPWVVTETNKDRTKVISSWYASSFEINTQCRPWVGDFHYVACEGTLSWDGTKAIIN